MSDLVLTVAQAAEQLEVSKDLVYGLIDSGALPAVRLGERRLVVPVHELRAFLAREARKNRRAS